MDPYEDEADSKMAAVLMLRLLQAYRQDTGAAPASAARAGAACLLQGVQGAGVVSAGRHRRGSCGGFKRPRRAGMVRRGVPLWVHTTGWQLASLLAGHLMADSMPKELSHK